MQNKLAVFVIIAILFGSYAVSTTYVFADAGCHSDFIFNWFTDNDVLECLDGAIGGVSSESTVVANVGSGTQLVKDSTSGNANIKTIVGSGDISITNTSNTVIVDFNGTIASSESTVCYNVGTGYLIIKNSTSGNCNVKSLLAGTGVTVSNGTNTITITNSITNVESLLNTNINSPQNGQQLTYNSTSAKWENQEESEIDVGGGYSLFYTTIGNVLEFKTLLAGSGVGISAGATAVTISNTSPESTTCTSAGGTTIVKVSGGSCTFYGLTAGTGLSITQNANDNQYTNTGVISNSCSSGISCSGTNPSSFTNSGVTSNVAGTGISVSGATGAVTVGNTGVISNSCSAPLSCSGTNPSAITCATCSTNSAQETTVCSNRGSGTWIIQNSTSGDCNVKTVTVSTGLSISNSTTLITFTNTGVISNSCSSGITCSGTNPSAISMTTQTACTSGQYVTQVSGSSSCSTAVVSGSCTSPISCSGTNPLAISCSTCLTTTNGDKFVQSGQYTSSASSAILFQSSGTAVASVYSSTTVKAIAEKITASSALVGKIVNTMSIGMLKTNSPTGTGTMAILDSSNNILYTFCTFNIASLTTSLVFYTCTNSASSYTIASGNYIGVTSPLQTGTNTATIETSSGNPYDGTNSLLSTYTSSWSDTSGSDLGSSAGSGTWQLDYMPNVSFTATKHLVITAEIRPISAGSFRWGLLFNGDCCATSTNYSYRMSLNNAADSTGASQKICLFDHTNTLTTGDDVMLYAFIDNNQSGDRKLITGSLVTGADVSSATAPSKIDFTCKWDNTTAQISSIAISSDNRPSGATAGDMGIGTIITVWGYN